MDYEKIYPDVYSLFVREIGNHKIANAYLFSCIDEQDGLNFSVFVARSLLCGIMPPCGFCSQCVFENHPDVFVVKKGDEDERVKVELVREAIKFSKIPPYSFHKFVIFHQAHLMTQQSFSALLKTVEEPKSFTTFFLITSKPELLPLTILSRCIKIRLFPKNLDDFIKQKIYEKFREIGQDDLKMLIDISFLNPSILDKINDLQEIHTLVDIIKFLISAQDDKISKLNFVKLVDEYVQGRDEARKILDSAEAFIAKNIEKLGKNGVKLKDKIKLVRRNIELFLNPKAVIFNLIGEDQNC